MIAQSTTIYNVGWGLLLAGFTVFCLAWAWISHRLTKRAQRERAEVQRQMRRDASHRDFYARYFS